MASLREQFNIQEFAALQSQRHTDRVLAWRSLAWGVRFGTVKLPLPLKKIPGNLTCTEAQEAINVGIGVLINDLCMPLSREASGIDNYAH